MALEAGFRRLMQNTARVYRADPNTAVEDIYGNEDDAFMLIQTLDPTDTTAHADGSGVRFEPIDLAKQRELVGQVGLIEREISISPHTAIAPPEAQVSTGDRWEWVDRGGRLFEVFAFLDEVDTDGSVHHYEVYMREVGVA